MQWLYFKAVSKSSRSSRGPANGRNTSPIFQTSIAFSNHLDLLVHSPLLDLISLDPSELCGGGSAFLFFTKCPFWNTLMSIIVLNLLKYFVCCLCIWSDTFNPQYVNYLMFFLSKVHLPSYQDILGPLFYFLTQYPVSPTGVPPQPNAGPGNKGVVSLQISFFNYCQ